MYEREADRVADAVMRIPEPGVQRQAEEGVELIQTKSLVEQITPLVQRQVEEEEKEEEENLQAKGTSGNIFEVTPNLESRIHALMEGGQSLPESVRAFFEPRFGYNFSQVRVHTDVRAAESAQALNARAFTMGRDIVFGAGRYAPETTPGGRLLAHELTHVVQQSGDNAAPGLLGTGKRPKAMPSHIQHGLIQREAPTMPAPASASRRSPVFKSLPLSEQAQVFYIEELERKRAPIRRWREDNTIELRLSLLSMAQLIHRVQLGVPKDAAELTDL